LFPDYVLLFYRFIVCLGGFMSTLSMSKADQAICDEFNLYEYGSAYLITMLDGYRFIAQHIDKNIINELILAKAKIELLSELGA